MKVQCVSREGAEEVATLMKKLGWARPAVVEITYDDVPNPTSNSEWWAVATPDDLDSLKGHVETLTVF